MTMLYEDDDYMDEDMGGMMLGGAGNAASVKSNPYIEFQRQMKAKGKTFKATKDKTQREVRTEAYGKWLKTKPYREWKKSLEEVVEVKQKKVRKPKVPKAQKPTKERAVPQRVALNAKRYDVHDVRKRLFSKSAKHPLSQYTAKEQDQLNQDLIALGSGVRKSPNRKVNRCPHCGGAWYDTVWDVVKTAAPYVAPLLL